MKIFSMLVLFIISLSAQSNDKDIIVDDLGRPYIVQTGHTPANLNSVLPAIGIRKDAVKKSKAKAQAFCESRIKDSEAVIKRGIVNKSSMMCGDGYCSAFVYVRFECKKL